MIRPSNKMVLLGRVVLCLMCLCYFTGCGKKGNPTMRSFEKPEAVKEMRAVHRDGKVTISWSYGRQAKILIKGFYIERAEGLLPYETIAFLQSDSSRYSDDRYEINKEYRYKIRVYSMRNVISDESPELKVSPLQLPDPPKAVTYRLTNDAVEITWDKGAEGITYNIYRSAEKGKYQTPLNAKPLDKPFFRDGVDTGKTVFYTIRSIVDSNISNEGDLSPDLEVNTQSFIPARPTDLRYVGSQNKGYLSWKENAETWVRGYKVYRSRASGESLPVATVSIPLFVDDEPVNVGTSYHVTALGPVKESGPSETVSVNP
jgi:hypothetical protein